MSSRNSYSGITTVVCKGGCIIKLEKALNSDRLNKKHINNKGYDKYLRLVGKVNISINYEKYNDDANGAD
jgi:hypothetical protein